MATEATIGYCSIEPNKFNPEQTQLVIGFTINGEKKYMRYCVAGGTEGQQKFASMQISKLLKSAGPYPVKVETNDRGYEDIYSAFDDGFRPGGGDDAGFSF